MAVVACVLAAWTCDREAAGPGRRVALAVEALLPATDLAAFNLAIDNVRLIVVRPPADTVLDQTFNFPADQSSLPIAADVPLEQTPETFHVTIQLLSGTTVLFEGTQDVTLESGQTPPPAQIPVSYSGPGQNVASLALDPVDSVLTQGATLQFRLTARDAQNALVPTFYASWTTSDTLVAKVGATGLLTAPLSRATVNVTARTPNDVVATTPITFVPVANAITIVSGCGQSDLPGAQLLQPVVVRVIAADQLGVQGVSVQFTPPAGGAVNPAQAVTDQNGLAQTTVTLGTTPGDVSLSIGASGVPSVTCGQTVQNLVSQLVFTAQPTGSVTAGAPFSVVVTAKDGLGNTVSAFTGTVTLSLGANPGGASFSPPTVGAVAGVATFANLSIGKAGIGYTLEAVSGALPVAVSAPFDIVPAAPAKLIFSTQPTSVQVGSPITPSVVVAARDAFDNPTPSFIGTVDLAIGTNPGSATLLGSTSVAAVTGIASFAGLSLDAAGTGYTLTAAATGLTGATSATFNVTPVAGLHLAFTTQPGTVTAGNVITPAVVVTAQDAQNNTVTSFTGQVTLGFGTCAVGALLSGTTTIAATAGVASFNDLSIDKAGGCTLVASSPSLQSVVSNSFTVAPGAPARLAFTVQPPPSVGAGVILSPAIQVEIEDALGNRVTTATNTVTIGFGNNPTGALLGGTLSKTAASGVAIFTDLSVNLAGTGYTLAATSGSLTAATSTAFDVTTGAATQLAITTQPSNATAGVAIAPAVTVEARDAQGNLVSGFTGNVTLALLANPGASLLSGTATRAAVAGVATFDDLSLNKAANGYTLRATSGVLTAATSVGFNITAGAASQLAFVAQPTSALQGAPIAPPVTVAVQDAFGNTVPSAVNSITITIGTNPNSGTLSGTSPVSAVNGVATFGDLSIDNPGTGYTLQAGATGLGSATSTPFDVLSSAAGVAWINASGGNWSVAANWSPARVPTKGDTVFITLGGTYTVTLDVNDTVAFLTVGGASGAQTLVASNRTLGIDSAASLLPGAILSLAGTAINGGGTLASGGTITVSPGTSVINATTTISAGGLLTLNGNNGFADLTVAGAVSNAGTIELTGTSWAGRLTAGALVNAPGGTLQTLAGAGNVLTAVLNNQGAVQVDGPLTLNAASAAHQNSGTITLGAGDLTLSQSGSAPSFTTTGSVVVGAGHVLQVNGGAFDYANAAPGGLAGLGAVNFNGVTLGLTPNVTQDTLTLALTNTTVNGPGTVTVAVGRTLTLTQSILNTALTNLGAVQGTPGLNVLNGTLSNQGGALLRLNGNNGFADVTVASGFTNAGTIELTGTSWAGRLTVTSGALLNAPTGTLRAVAGAGNVLSSVLNNQGTVQVDGPLTLNAASAAHQNSGTITLGAGDLALNQSGTTPSFTTSGDVVLGAGRTWSVSGGTLAYAGGKIEGNGTLALSGVALGLGVSLTHDTLQVSLNGSTVNGPGTLTVAPGATMTVAQTTFNAAFVNQGTVQATPGTNVFNGSFSNPAGALLRLNGNNGFADVTVATGFTNAGTIELTGTSWAGRLTVGSPTTATLVNASGATLRAVGGAGNVLTAQLNNQGSVLVNGPLTLNGLSADHQNSGTIMLGSGDLTLSQTGTTPSFTTTGSMIVGSGRVLQVNGGAFNYANASPGGLAGLGTVSFSGVTLGLTPNVTQDTLTLGLSNTIVNGPGTLTVLAGRTLTLTQSTLNTALNNLGVVQGTPGLSVLTGPLSNQSGALLRLNGNNGFADMTVASGFTNTGAIELTGTSWAGRLTVTSGSLVNGPGATLRTVAGAGNVLTGALDNQGTLLVDAPLTVNGVSADHQNSGTITLGAGDLTLSQSGTTPSFTTTGTVLVGTGRTWTVNGGALDYAGGAIGGDGTMALSGVTLGLQTTLTHDTLPVSLSVSLTNSTVNGPGTLPVAATSTLTLAGTTVNAPLVNFGTLQAAPGTNVLNGAVTNVSGALLRLNGNNGFADVRVANGFTNNGTIELTGTSWAGRLTVGSAASPLVNAPGAMLQTVGGAGNVLTAVLNNQGTVQVGGPLTMDADSAAHGNSGLIKLVGGDLTVTLSGFRPGLGNTGTIDVGTNKLTVNGTGSFVNQSTGVFMGSGTFDVSAPSLSFITDGKTIVGAPSGIGTLTFKGYYLMGPTGSIDVEVGTPTTGAFDQLKADSVNLQGGTLNVQIGTVSGQLYPIILVPLGNSLLGDFQTKNIDPVPKCALGPSGSAYVINCP